MKKNRSIQKKLSLILSFFLFLSWFGIFFCMQMLSGFFSEQNFRKSLRESDYSRQSWKLLNESITALLNENSIQLNARDLMNEDKAYLYLTNYTDRVFDGEKGTAIRTELEQDIKTQILEYLGEYQVTLTQASEQSLDSAVKTIGATVNRYVLPEFITRFNSFIQTYRVYFNWALGISAIIMLMISIILLFLHHYKHRAVRYMVCAVSGAILTNIVLFILGQQDIIRGNMLAGPDYYQLFLEQFIKHSFEQWFIMNGIGLLIAFAGLCAMQALRHKTK